MNRLSISLVIIPLALTAGAARANDAAVRTELERQYQQIARAVQQKDFAALEGFVTPDYTSTDAYGTTRNHDQTVALWKQEIQPLRNIIYNLRIESLQAHGDEATAIVRSWATFEGAAPDNQGPPIEMRSVDRETWRHGGHGWKVSATVGLDEQFRQGGSLFRPGETPEAAAVRQQLQPLYDGFAKALDARDYEAQSKALPPDFRARGFDGKPVTPQQIVDGNRQGLQHALAINSWFEIAGVRVEGDKAVVLRTLYLTVDNPDKPEQPRKVRQASTARETWMKTDHGWTPRLGESLLSQASVDGAPPSLQVAGLER
jgi:ketosteroid isomerase-like protein